MKKEFALLLANVLEFGGYVQIRGQNHSEDGSCIAGVVIDLFLRQHPKFQFEINETHRIPREILVWADIYSNSLALRSSEVDAKIELQGDIYSWFYSLRGANDGGVSFPVMADWIRKNYPLI